MKKLTLPLLITGALMAQSALAAQQQRAISYFAFWSGPEASAVETLKEADADTLLLAFGGWDVNGNIYSFNDIVAVPAYNPWDIQAKANTAWTQIKHAQPNKKMMVAFGGETYEGMWEYLDNPATRENLAQNMVKLLDTKFPVYKKNLKPGEMVGECQHTTWDGQCDMSVNQLAGTVELDGIDFDFEKRARLTDQDNQNVLAVAQRVRELLNASGSKKLISLTTYHVGADPVNCCSNTVTENCSFVEDKRSDHHGEVLPLLKEGKDVFDFFNVMAYDAGKHFKYDVAMANYARAVGDKSKIVLGQTINDQWASDNRFVETRENNVHRAGWQAQNGYGGFFIWNLGANNQQMAISDQVGYFNEMKQRADAMSPDRPDIDDVAPTVPENLHLLNNSQTITFTWNPSSDNVGVHEYVIARDGREVGSAKDTQWTDTNVETGGVIYRYTVKARDKAGNVSAASKPLQVETIKIDDARPSVPNGLNAQLVEQTSLQISWNAATNAKKYRVLRNGNPVATVQQNHFADSNLTAGTEYHYSVIAVNAKDEESEQSATLTVKTKDATVTPEPEKGTWKVGVTYMPGDEVTWQGKHYKCLAQHPSMAHWAPAEATASLWKLLD